MSNLKVVSSNLRVQTSEMIHSPFQSRIDHYLLPKNRGSVRQHSLLKCY